MELSSVFGAVCLCMIAFVSAFLGQARDSPLFPLLEFIPRKDGRKERNGSNYFALFFFGAFCGLITLLALDSSSFLRFSIKNISYRPISHIIDMLASDYCLLLCFLFLQFYRLILRVLPYKDRCWYSRCIAVSLNYWLVARLAFLRRQLTATGKRRDDDTTTIV